MLVNVLLFASSVTKSWLFVTPQTAVSQVLCPSLSLRVCSNSCPFNHFTLCCPLLFLPSIFPSHQSHFQWVGSSHHVARYWSFSFSISPSNKYLGLISFKMGFPCDSAGKESTCNVGDPGSIPGLGRSSGEGKGYPFQYSGLENVMDCIVLGVAKSQTWLSKFHFPLGLTGFISLLSKGLSRVFSSTTIQKHQLFGVQPSLRSNSHICTWLLEKPQLGLYRALSAKWSLCFLIYCLGLS